MAKLYLIPTTLSNTIDHNVLLDFQLKQIQHIKYFIVETAKIARMHLKQLNLVIPLQQLYLNELNKHSQDLNTLIQPLLDGFDVGLMSDCGLPAIADPGSKVVRWAHLNNIEVVPLIGPSSLLLALMASGVNGQSFAFNGYLPVDNIERKQKILQLQTLILKNQQSQIIIETPFRNQYLFEALVELLDNKIILCVAINIMQDNQKFVSQSVEQWKCLPQLPNMHKQEVVFVIGEPK